MKTFILWCTVHELTCHVTLWLIGIMLVSYFDNAALTEYGFPGIVTVGGCVWVVVAMFVYPFLKGVLEAIESQGEKDE